jgi:competence protein ComEC
MNLFVYYCFAYIMGILTIKNQLYFGLGCVTLCVYIAYVFRKESQKYKVFLLMIMVSFYLFGCLRTMNFLDNLQLSKDKMNQDLTIKGQVVSVLDEKEQETRLIIKTKDLSQKKTFKLVVYLPIRIEGLAYGDTLTVKGQLALGSRAKNPGEFNYREYLQTQKVAGLFYVNRTEQTVYEPGHFSILRGINESKRQIESMVLYYLPQEEGRIFNSIFFGDQTFLEKNEKEMFSELGILHIFAVSGSNVAGVVCFLLMIAILFKLKPLFRNGLIIIGILYYTALTGFTPSVLRASIMAICLLFALISRKEMSIYSGLALSALIILIYNPCMIGASGFILSFMVTWGLVYFTPLIVGWFKLPTVIAHYIGGILAAECVTFPLTAYFFNLVSLISILTNLLIVPLISLVANLGLFIYLIGLIFKPLAIPLIYGVGTIIHVSLWLLKMAHQFPWGYFYIKTPALWLIILTYIFLILLKELKETGQSKMKITIGFLCLASYSFYFVNLQSSYLMVYFLDVGQGDAIVIKTSTQKIILVDGGGQNRQGSYNAGKNTIIPFLRRQGFGAIDVLVSTHPDQDHLGGLFPVVETIPVRFVLLPPVAYFDHKYDSFIKLIKKRGIPYGEGMAGMNFKIDNLVCQIMNPPREPLKTTNDNSLALLIEDKGNRFLLTGDCEKEALQALPIKQKIQVVKVPHHGSKNCLDPKFYERTKLSLAIIPVGKNNFGHPSIEVQNYFKQNNIPVYRTDWDGCITLIQKKETLFVKTMGRELE